MSYCDSGENLTLHLICPLQDMIDFIKFWVSICLAIRASFLYL